MAASFTHGCVSGGWGGGEGGTRLAGLCEKGPLTRWTAHPQNVDLAWASPLRPGLAKPPQATENVNSKTAGGRGARCPAHYYFSADRWLKRI